MPDPMVDLELLSRLQDSAYHAAERAWSGFVSFLTAQALLAAAWAALWAAGDQRPPVVLTALSIIGVLSGFVWSMLGTRMWQYHLEYVDKMRDLTDTFDVERFGTSGAAWRDVDEKIWAYWRDDPEFAWFRGWSGNQRVMFWGPMILGAVHFLMFWITFSANEGVQVGALIVYGVLWAGLWNVCEPILNRPVR